MFNYAEHFKKYRETKIYKTQLDDILQKATTHYDILHTQVSLCQREDKVIEVANLLAPSYEILFARQFLKNQYPVITSHSIIERIETFSVYDVVNTGWASDYNDGVSVNFDEHKFLTKSGLDRFIVSHNKKKKEHKDREYPKSSLQYEKISTIDTHIFEIEEDFSYNFLLANKSADLFTLNMPRDHELREPFSWQDKIK
jgi:hypothetical protein